MKSLGLAVLLAVAAPLAAAGAGYDELNAGIEARNSGDWITADAHFDKALAAGDLPPGLQYLAHLDRGEVLIHQGRPDLAIDDYSASLQLRPADAGALTGRAAAYSGMGKFDEAVADLGSLIAVRPFNTKAYLARAILNNWLGRFDKGLEDLKTVRAQDPGNTAIHRPMGVAEWQMGQVQDAERDFSAALSDKPDDLYSWIWLSLTEARQGKPVSKRSLPDFDKATWPAPIADLFLGNIDRDAVFAAAAQQGVTSTVEGQTCEANFYVGEWLLQHHDAAGAKPLIQKAASDCPRDFIEWSPAQSELKSLP